MVIIIFGIIIAVIFFVWFNKKNPVVTNTTTIITTTYEVTTTTTEPIIEKEYYEYSVQCSDIPMSVCNETPYWLYSRTAPWQSGMYLYTDKEFINVVDSMYLYCKEETGRTIYILYNGNVGQPTGDYC